MEPRYFNFSPETGVLDECQWKDAWNNERKHPFSTLEWSPELMTMSLPPSPIIGFGSHLGSLDANLDLDLVSGEGSPVCLTPEGLPMSPNRQRGISFSSEYSGISLLDALEDDLFLLPSWFSGPLSATPSLNIIPKKIVNFRSYHIGFVVLAYNIPPGIDLKASMMEGVVKTPKGQLIECQIVKNVKENECEVDSFRGTFTSSDEVGMYQLTVNLKLPDKVPNPVKYTVLEETTPILVSRNIFRDSAKAPLAKLQVPFVPKPLHPNMTESDYEAYKAFPSKLWGFTYDKHSKRFFITDRMDDSVSCLDAVSQKVLYKISKNGVEGGLNHPTGIAYDHANRRLLVVDKDNHKVRFFTPDGEYISSFSGLGFISGCLQYPWDVAVSLDGGQIAVTDSRNHRVQVFDRYGKYVNGFSPKDAYPQDYKKFLDYPRGVTFSADGSLIYVTDFNNGNVLEISVDANMYRPLLPPKKLFRPQGVAVDSLGALVVCDSKTKSLRHIFPPGNEHILSNVYSIGSNHFDYPLNVVVMEDDLIAVLESNGKINIF